MKKTKITFVCPIRGREDMRPHYEANIAKCFSSITYEIIYVQQCDDGLILPNQLRNIGMMNANSEYIAYRDVDFIDLEPVDLIGIYKQYNKPCRVYDKRQHIVYTDGENYELKDNAHKITGCGYAIFKKEDFERLNGLTNLCVGWGYEDDMNFNRYNMASYDRVLGHIYHPSNDSFGTKDTDLNGQFYRLDKEGKIDPQKDGYKQMVYDVVSDIKISDNIREIKVKNITVIDDYEYKDLLNKHF